MKFPDNRRLHLQPSQNLKKESSLLISILPKLRLSSRFSVTFPAPCCAPFKWWWRGVIWSNFSACSRPKRLKSIRTYSAYTGREWLIILMILIHGDSWSRPHNHTPLGGSARRSISQRWLSLHYRCFWITAPAKMYDWAISLLPLPTFPQLCWLCIRQFLFSATVYRFLTGTCPRWAGGCLGRRCTRQTVAGIRAAIPNSLAETGAESPLSLRSESLWYMTWAGEHSKVIS